MNHCPVYLTTGGHAYGWVYPGPMGAVLTPQFIGIEQAHHLPSASSFCGRCEAVCPVRIPLPQADAPLARAGSSPSAWPRRPRATARGSGRSPPCGRRSTTWARASIGDASACSTGWAGAARPLPPPAAGRRLDRLARPAGAARPDLPGALAGAGRAFVSEDARDAVLERLRRSLHRRGPGASAARRAVARPARRTRAPGLIPARGDLDLEGRIKLFISAGRGRPGHGPAAAPLRRDAGRDRALSARAQSADAPGDGERCRCSARSTGTEHAEPARPGGPTTTMRSG